MLTSPKYTLTETFRIIFDHIAGCLGPTKLVHKINRHGSQGEGHRARLHFSLLESREGERSQGRGWGLCGGPWAFGGSQSTVPRAPRSAVRGLFSPGLCPFPPAGVGLRYPLASLNSSAGMGLWMRRGGVPHSHIAAGGRTPPFLSHEDLCLLPKLPRGNNRCDSGPPHRGESAAQRGMVPGRWSHSREVERTPFSPVQSLQHTLTSRDSPGLMQMLYQ